MIKDTETHRAEWLDRLPTEYHGDKWENDMPSVFDIYDSENQWLSFRVGMVFSGNNLDPQEGIWIEYQPKYMESDLMGPVLVSKSTMKALVKWYKWRTGFLYKLRRKFLTKIYYPIRSYLRRLFKSLGNN